MIKRLRHGYKNCYLLKGDDGGILVDTGYVKDGKKLFEQLKDENIKLIFLTHCHFDHVGSAEYLSKRLGAPIAMNSLDNSLIGHGTNSILHGHTLWGRIMSSCSQFVLKRAVYSSFVPAVSLTEGFDLSPYGVSAHAVALPGHTPGTTGIITDDGKAMIVGDAMFDMMKPTGSRLYEDYDEMCRSAEKIRGLDPDVVYVGHGAPITRRKFPRKY